ncbi:Glutamine-dependent NAD(+) synthetase [bioreactor metagenome]|uniref:Glutamine-dependent NAD(+) synthetase n=1 Tax=bioreactor metagenome TaxID=1076179 RepID=A0A644ZWM9_9ZZZZ
MSMYNPNHSLTKTTIREVVGWYASACVQEGLSEVLFDILETPVSPELIPTEDGKMKQKTEEVLGAYELHDFFLYHMAVLALEPSDILLLAQRAFSNYEPDELRRILKVFYKRFLTQQFKRSPSPEGARVISFSLSPRGDWSMPSDLQIENWMNELEELC